jgi:hypothetical protein
MVSDDDGAATFAPSVLYRVGADGRWDAARGGPLVYRCPAGGCRATARLAVDVAARHAERLRLSRLSTLDIRGIANVFG